MNPLKRYAHRGANKVLHSFKCEICAHSVTEHKRALPQYEKYSNKELSMMIQQELNLKNRTLPFCHILTCDTCEILKCQQEHNVE